MAPDSADSNGECIRAYFRIEPDVAANCAVLASGPAGNNIRQNVVTGPSDTCECRAETTIECEQEPRYVRGAVSDHCICPVFDNHDCVASIESFDGGELAVSVSTADREELAQLVSSLRAVNATVRLQRISSTGESSGSRTIELDATVITEKQREAVRAAIEGGYYETPRRIDLSGLADELDVSPSAVSQRLSAVESSLVAALFEVVDGPPSRP